MMRHSKGPWKLHLVDDCTIIDAYGRPVATTAAEIDDALDYNQPDDWPVMEATPA